MDARPPDSTQRFSECVDDYVRYRPSYPIAVVELLRRKCGLTPEWAIADIGSGPGNLSHLFLGNGNCVFGTEPNREMRAAGERLLGDFPRFATVASTAERTTLPDASMDLVIAGQAFHWFDADRARCEFARILRPPRRVALVWNERRVDSTPFLAAYERLLLAHGTDYAAVRHQDVANATALGHFFGAGGYERAAFENRQMFDFEGLRGRLLLSSYAPAAGQPEHDPLLGGLRAAFETSQEGGVVAFEYNTAVYYGRLQ